MAENTATNPEPKSESKAETAEAKKAEEWKPRKGAPCVAVYVRGGPKYVLAAGKIAAVHSDGTVDVDYAGPKANACKLEHVGPARIESGHPASVGYLPPA